MSLPVMDYDYNSMKLSEVFKDSDYQNDTVLLDNEIFRTVYGKSLSYTENNNEYPYLYSSVVTSVDGKIAFNDAPIGPLISQKNKNDQDGAMADWWMLNALRSAADGIMFGANTLNSEKETTGHIYDKLLTEDRIKNDKGPVPVNIIPTLDGNDIPFNHLEFSCKQIPVIIYTSEKGCANLKDKGIELIEIKENFNIKDINTENIYVLITGKEIPDNKLGMKKLKAIGFEKILIESPTITHLLIKDKLLNEMYMNQSGIYLGGNSLSIGSGFPGFETSDFPHTSLVSLHMHSKDFLYFRYRLEY